MVFPKALIILLLHIIPVQSQQTSTHNLQFQDPSLLLMQCTYHLWRLSNQTPTLAAFDNILTSNYYYGLWTLRSVDSLTTTPPVISFHEQCSVNIIIHKDQLYPDHHKITSILANSDYTFRTKNHNMFIFIFTKYWGLPTFALKLGTKLYLHTLSKPSSDQFPQYYFCPWCLSYINPLTADLSITSMDYSFIKRLKNKEGLLQPRLDTGQYYYTHKPGSHTNYPWLSRKDKPYPRFCNNIAAIYDSLSQTFNFTLKGASKMSPVSKYGKLTLAVRFSVHSKLEMNTFLYFGLSTRKILYCRPKITTKTTILLSFYVWSSPFGYEIYIALFLLSLILIILAKLTVLDCLALLIAQGINIRGGGRNWLIIIVSLLLTTIIASSYQNLITSKLIVPPEYKHISNLSELVKNGGKIVVSYAQDYEKKTQMSLAKLDFIKSGIEATYFPKSVVFWSLESNRSTGQFDLVRSSPSTVFRFWWMDTEVETARFKTSLTLATGRVVEEVGQHLGNHPVVSQIFSWNYKSILGKIREYHEHGFTNFWTGINLHLIRLKRVWGSRKGANVHAQELELKARNVLNLSDLASVYLVYACLTFASVLAFLFEKTLAL